MRRIVWTIASFLLVGFGAGAQAQQTGLVRTYYIAADELDWDYMPSGRDAMMGMAPRGYARFFAQHGPHYIGRVYRKALYREYTDATFAHLKPRPADEAYLGTVGPIIHAAVGDTIRVVFRNNGSHPYSMHPHGVLYEAASEGSAYDHGTNASAPDGNSVAPGKTFT